MFYPDLEGLEKFYDSSLGEIAYNNIKNSISCVWPEVDNEIVLGIGYSQKYLKRFIDKNNIIASVIPSISPLQDELPYWKIAGVNNCILTSGFSLPFADNSVDKIILIHALEYIPNIKAFLREIWRILTPCARLLVIVPNKMSLWSGFTKCPIHNSKLFTLYEILELLNDALLFPQKTSSTIFMMPDVYKLLPFTSNICESIGSKWLVPFGGMLVIEAEKQLYALNKPSAKKTKKFLFKPKLMKH